jgi:hypothetical protein
MSCGVSSKKGLSVVFAVFFSFLLASSIASSAYVPIIKFEVPLKDEARRDMGLFIRNASMNVDFNLTFDYPFPLGPGEAMVTAEIVRQGEDQPIQTKTLPLRPFLEKYKIITNGEYVFRPIYFNFSVDARGRNVSYEPITFGYSVSQRLREPYPGEGDSSWKVWGRYVSDQTGGTTITDAYCSGWWDFVPSGEAWTCNSTMGGSSSNGDNGNCNGQTCTSSDCCVDACCPPAKPNCCDCTTEVQTYMCCYNDQICDCANTTSICSTPQASFPAGTQIKLAAGTKTIETMKAGDEVLSFENGNVVKKKVSYVLPPHKSGHYYVIKTQNREVEVTDNHYFYTSQGFRQVSTLQKGDQVYVLGSDGKMALEEITFSGIIIEDIEVYDFEVEGTHTYFANGFAVHNAPVTQISISRGSYTTSADGKTVPYQSNGPILYVEVGDNDKQIPNTPGSGSLAVGEWAQGHSWKFETFIRSKVNYQPYLRVYTDDGGRIRIREYPNGEWFEKDCLNNKTLNVTTTPCIIQPPNFLMNRWYQIQVYLFNDPGNKSGGLFTPGKGQEDNPTGIRIEDQSGSDKSIIQLFGGETAATMNSGPPGADGITITGSATIYGNQGLAEIREFSVFSTEHWDASCDNSNVRCSLRMACGNEQYPPPPQTGIRTNKYGWILNHPLDPQTWDIVGGNPITRSGYVKVGSNKIDFDYYSVTNERYLYTNLEYGELRYIGGIYECKKDWPSFEIDCPDPNKRYNYTKSLDTYKCCYADFSVPSLAAGDYKILLNDYKSGAGWQYIINFLPPYKNKGDKLCAASTAMGFGAFPVQSLYQSNYTNQFCNPNLGTRCCFCRPGPNWGCRLDCISELNVSGNDKFTLPFPATGQFWELKDFRLIVTGTESRGVVNLTANGNVQDGWTIQAVLGDNARLVLDRNYTIPLNLFSDFGLTVPDERGPYILRLNITYNTSEGWKTVFSPYTFWSVDCKKEGDKRNFYDESAYPGTKGKGICKPGLQVCKKLTENDLRWRYETTYDMPVYPAGGSPVSETCNAKDDDCNGVIDDVKSFEEIINEIIRSGGRKTPYQVTQCGCFMGAAAKSEKCNAIDDDCNERIDDPDTKLWVNTCDNVVTSCMDEGSPYDWCRRLYNSSQCGLKEITIASAGNVSVNSCTQKVRACMNNIHLFYLPSSDDPVLVGNFTYDECRDIYNNFSCLFQEQNFVVLEDTCKCTDPLASPAAETCNGVDDDCNGIIDDVEYAGTCGCAYQTNATLVHNMKASSDASCDGIDSNCNGVIDDDARDCACTRRTPKEADNIRLKVSEICDGIDNNCNGLKDENFPNLGKPCGYGICTGGAYVCNVHGDEAVCNTTVSPDQTFSGYALKLSSDEVCDLKDNDCDYSIDENCACTPEGAVKLCGYQSGIYFRSREQLTQTCGQVMQELKKLITWAEAPENIKYRQLVTVKNSDNVMLAGYPVNVSLNSILLIEQGKLRRDGGDLRIIPAGEEKNLAWSNSSLFGRSRTVVWFKTDLKPNEEKQFYMYYGNPVATYKPPALSAVIGIDYARGVFLLCHFDRNTTCEGNMVPEYANGVTYSEEIRPLNGEDVKMTGVYVDGVDVLSYPTSENFNKNRGTLLMWFKPSDITPIDPARNLTKHYLFYSKDFYGKPQLELYFDENGTFFVVWDKLGNSHRLDAGIVNLEWHHIAATWDNLKGINVYFDGILKASKNAVWEPSDIGTDVYIGGDGSAQTSYAIIDELAVYSQELDLTSIRERMRYYKPQVSVGGEESLNETIATTEASVFEKCNAMLENVSSSDSSRKATILSLCDSARTCNKTDFPINAISECTFGTQECSSGVWYNCTAVMPKTEMCNQKDDDCNGVIDDVAVPETCACSNGGKPGQEFCNGVDDNCNGMIDDVKGGSSPESTHCGCFDQVVNITQKINETETRCNGIDDNCNGVIDEGLDKCACKGTKFNPFENTWYQAISIEKCDDTDNDCNEKIDDPWQQNGSQATKFEYLGAPCSPLNSRCIGGMYVCNKNGFGIVCSTSSEEGVTGDDLRMNETCNAIDDDCNGKIDDVWGEISYKFCGCYNGISRNDEKCDGVDNDCNGFVDDGLTNCGCSFDLEANAENINQLAVLINAKKTSGETCNNIDDNCNGVVDDAIEGVCFCSGGFDGNPAVRPEFCNGVDDDCDGIIDDVTNPLGCACYNGTHKSGELKEICDGVDNNCNGLIDEAWPSLGSACGLGVCSGGIYECSNDTRNSVCSTGPGGSGDKSVDEVCGDSVDNNCDGVADETCECDVAGEKKKCSVNAGICREGVQTCTESGWSSCIGGILPVAEVCDTIDNNCNNVVDDIPGGRCGCYGGVEQRSEVCNGVDDDCNGIVDDVGGKDSVEETKCGCYNNTYGKDAKLEVCNQIDDDCNGVIDDARGGSSVAATRCACYGDALPGVESCNKMDDDCDETTDEDWSDLGSTCGQGMCTGTFICSPDGKTIQCDGKTPEVEVCDSKDNDCDGEIDEGCRTGPEAGSCEDGIQNGDEEGIDCGGSCPKSCAAPPILTPSGTWMLVFAALVAVIVVVGIVLVLLRPKEAAGLGVG